MLTYVLVFYALGLLFGWARRLIPAVLLAVFLFSPGATLLIVLVGGVARFFLKGF